MLYIGKPYFEGYEEKFILKRNGRGFKKVRLYTGDVYRVRDTRQQWLQKKIVFAVSCLLFYLLLFQGGLLNARSNHVLYIVLPYAVSLIAGSYCAIGIFHYLISKMDMTVFEFHEYRKQIQSGSAAASCSMAVSVFANLICIGIWLFYERRPLMSLRWEWCVLAANAACCFIMAMIYRLEKTTEFILIPGESETDEKGK